MNEFEHKDNIIKSNCQIFYKQFINILFYYLLHFDFHWLAADILMKIYFGNVFFLGGSWVHGFMGSWVHGFMGSWVHKQVAPEYNYYAKLSFFVRGRSQRQKSGFRVREISLSCSLIR